MGWGGTPSPTWAETHPGVTGLLALIALSPSSPVPEEIETWGPVSYRCWLRVRKVTPSSCTKGQRARCCDSQTACRSMPRATDNQSRPPIPRQTPPCFVIIFHADCWRCWRRWRTCVTDRYRIFFRIFVFWICELLQKIFECYFQLVSFIYF